MSDSQVLITITQITSNSAFDALQADWHRLAASPRYASIFNTWHWNRLWWEHYAHLGDLFILVIRLNNTVECIAPFYLGSTRALRVKSMTALRFLGSGGDTSPDDLNILMGHEQEHHDAIVDTLCQYLTQHKDIKRFELRDIPEQSVFLHRFIKHAVQSRMPHVQLQTEQRLVTTLPATIDDFLGTLSRNTRKHWKRRQRQLNQAGEAQFLICKTPDEVQQTLDELINLHRSRRTSLGDQGSFESQAYIEFHRALMFKLLERDELRLLTLKLDGKTIGIEYAFLVNKVLCFFQTGFDPAFEHLSPGHLLMTHLIETAIAQQATSIDLLKGSYEYKSSYAKQMKTTMSLTMWRNPLVALCYRAAARLSASA